jgi:hypothetical protein
MKRAGELRLEYGKRDIFCRPTPHEPTGSRTPEPNRNDCLAELLKREHHALRIGVHPGNVGLGLSGCHFQEWAGPRIRAPVR